MAYSTISKSTNYFTPKLYTGNGSSQTITGLNFEPDMTWLRARSGASGNEIYDAVRGATYRIYPNISDGGDALVQGLQAWTSDGFTVGSASGINANGANLVGWNWKANGAGVANTAGSINSTVSANTTSGFSIVKFVGTGATATVGHGLGVAPRMIIIKYIDGSANWGVYHQSLGNTKAMFLDLTGTEGTSNDYWNSTSPTSDVFSVNTFSGFNYNGGNMIAYCFAEIPGFSKFGLYEANGNANGPFVYTGFKPSFMMVKAKGQTESWYILDNKRPGYNTNNYYLNPNTNSAEGTSTTLANSLLSNGFKPNNADTSMNTSGQGYIYMAFGQTLVGSNNVPATAR